MSVRLAHWKAACEPARVDVARFGKKAVHELERNLLGGQPRPVVRVPLRNPLAGRFCNPLVNKRQLIAATVNASMGGRQWRSGSVCRGAGGS